MIKEVWKSLVLPKQILLELWNIKSSMFAHYILGFPALGWTETPDSMNFFFKTQKCEVIRYIIGTGHEKHNNQLLVSKKLGWKWYMLCIPGFIIYVRAWRVGSVLVQIFYWNSVSLVKLRINL